MIKNGIKGKKKFSNNIYKYIYIYIFFCFRMNSGDRSIVQGGAVKGGEVSRINKRGSFIGRSETRKKILIFLFI